MSFNTPAPWPPRNGIVENTKIVKLGIAYYGTACLHIAQNGIQTHYRGGLYESLLAKSGSQQCISQPLLCRIKFFEWNAFARPRYEMPVEALLIFEFEDG